MFRSVKVVKGNGGWGGPLVIQPTEERNVILSVTGGGIHSRCTKNCGIDWRGSN